MEFINITDIAYTYIGLVTTMTKHYVEDGVPLIFNSSIKENGIDDSKTVYLDYEFAEKNKNRKHQKGDIVTVHTGDIGTSAIITEKYNGSLGFATIVTRIKDKNKVLPEFLLYYLNYCGGKQQLYKYARDARNNLNLADYNRLVVPLISIKEQKYIINLVNNLKTIIEEKKKEIVLLDELVKSRFIELFGNLVFGDKIKTNQHKIGEIASVTKLAGFEFTKFIHYQDHGDIIMLRGLNCKKGHLILDDIKWIDKNTSDLLPRSKLYYGDILMTYAGTIGDVALVDSNDKYHLAPNVAKITLNNKDDYNPIFLIHLFMYSHEYIMTFASQVAQPSINMEKIRNFQYYFPEINKQNEFAEFVEKVDKSKFKIQQSLDKTQILFDSLMQEYFG